MTKFASLLSVLLGFSLALHVAEHVLLAAIPPSPQEWKACWIWNADEENAANGMLLARKDFRLDAVPATARLYITADTRYQLFVNGRFVNRGPARSSPDHQSFDALEIAPYLRSGANQLAVRVLHTGLGRSYHQPPRAGLLVQVEVDGRVIGTDGSWKVRPDPTWSRESPRINGWHDGFSDIVDLREYLQGWKEPGFDDSRWQLARCLLRSSGWPEIQADAAPVAMTPPWVALTPRDIPLLVEKYVRANRLIQAGTLRDQPELSFLPLGEQPAQGVSGASEYQKAQGALILDPPGNDAAFAVFDLEGMVNGHPRLSLSGPRGTVVEVMTAPYMLNNRFDPLMLRSRQIDRIVLSGGQDEWEAFDFKAARFLAIVARNGGGPVRISEAGSTAIEYPFKNAGDFHAAGDEVLEQLWEAGAKTVRAVTTDAYTDNYRERRQYAQTSYYAARGNYAAFGDPYLQRRYLVQIAQQQEPDGILPSYAPLTGDDFMVILESGLFWVRGLRDYLLFTGDADTARTLLPVATKVLGRMHEITNRSGLIEDPPYPYWLDHSPLDRRGANFVLNGHYLLALEDYAEALEWLNDPAAKGYRAQAARVRTALRAGFWDPRERLFVDAVVRGEQSPRFSEHSNAMALLAGIATAEQAAAISGRLLSKESGLVPVTPAFMDILVNGLAAHGHVAQALALLKDRFGKFLNQGNGTLWEEWWLDATMRTGRLQPHSRADAQGESAFTPLTMCRWVLGLRPTQPKMAEVVVEYTNSGVQRASGTMPSPHGVLSVAWSVRPDELALDVRCPAGMAVELDLESIVSAGFVRPVGAKRRHRLPAGKSVVTFRRAAQK
jgi:hypothetical protein